MKTSLIVTVILYCTALCSVVVGADTVKSPRSSFVLKVPSDWNNTELEMDVVKIQKENAKGAEHTVLALLTSKGLRTVVVPEEFGYRVTTTLPTDEFPFILVVIEKQKEGIETELIEAIALNSGVARFLTEEEYGILAGAHEAVPAIIDSLNDELNKLQKTK